CRRGRAVGARGAGGEQWTVAALRGGAVRAVAALAARGAGHSDRARALVPPGGGPDCRDAPRDPGPVPPAAGRPRPVARDPSWRAYRAAGAPPGGSLRAGRT